MKLVNFQEKYPNYNLGFLANNEETETEKLTGFRMRLLFRDNKTYQSFSIPKEDYQELIERIHNCKPGYVVEMTLNDATMRLFLKDNTVIGYCVETRERVAIDDFWVTRFVIGTNDNTEAFWHQALK